MKMGCSPPAPSNIVLGGYDGSLAGLSLSADSTTALTLSLKFAYNPHPNAVRSLALEGSILASGGVDEMIRVYDLGKKVEVGMLLRHEGTVNALEFVHDSARKLLFSCSDDKSICVWRCSDWTCLKQLRGHNAAVLDISVHPSAQVALSVAKDNSFFMWNLAKGKVAFSCKTKVSTPSAVQWSPSGNKYALTGSKVLTLSDVSGKPVSALGHSHPILCHTFINNSEIATGGEEKVVRLWDTRDSTKSVAAFEHDRRVRSIASIDGLLVSADSGGGLKIWDVRMRGQPRIETAIADGQLRLTCMTAGVAVEPTISASTQKTVLIDDETETKSKREAESNAEVTDEANPQPSALHDTASQRKRKKRKVKKAL